MLFSSFFRHFLMLCRGCVLLTALMGFICSPKFDRVAYDQTRLLQQEVVTLMQKGDRPYKDYAPEIERVKREVAQASQYASSKKKNKEMAEVWRILENDLMNPYFEHWKNQGRLDKIIVSETAKQLDRSFESIARAEMAKSGGGKNTGPISPPTKPLKSKIKYTGIKLLPSWPPYPPSSFYSIDLDEKFKNVKTLYDLWKRFEKAFKVCGYAEVGLFEIPNANGFAVVIHAEKIESDGTPIYKPDRFDISVKSLLTPYDIGDHLVSMLTGKTGLCRQILFVVTDVRYSKNGPKEYKTSLYLDGVNALPTDWANIPFNQNYTIEALIYEYKVQEQENNQKMMPSNVLDAKTHLEKSKLLSKL